MQRIGSWGLLLIAVLLVSCATARKKGDRAFEEGEYQRALDHYEKVIDKGTKDWEIYYRAARAATHVGSFSLAERYYGRSLRNGGGTKVARSFAEFYLKTSNYSKAVRLLQFLLDSGLEKQPIYNNLGTALMYAGAPIDSESYLLIAQQMDPKDPVPYINLGVLYERYLHRPKLSFGFYRCYMKLTKDASQRERVQSRIADLSSRYGPVDTGVECGEPYKPKSSGDPGNLRAQLEELKSGNGDVSTSSSSRTGSSGAERGDEKRPIDLKFEGMDRGDEEAGEGAGGQGDTGVVVERGARRRRDGGREVGPAFAEADGGERLDRARRAWKHERHQKVVDIVSEISVAQMSVEGMRLYGLSLAELGRNEEAKRWLEWVVERKPDPRALQALIEVYRRLERSEELRAVCEKFRGREDYEEVVESCPEPDEQTEIDSAEKLRRIREQLKRKKRK